MDKLVKAGVKVVQRDGRPWGVLQVHPTGDEVTLIICSESGTTVSHQMSKGDYDRLPEDGELRETELETVSPPEEAGEKTRVVYVRVVPKQ